MSTPQGDLVRAFKERTLDPASFRHADHVVVAYEMLRSNEFLHAASEYAKGIREMATRAGAPHKFNTTITIAFMSLIAERMRTTPHDGYRDFVARNPDLMNRDVLDRWYTTERLQSEAARHVFVMPNPT